jgi:hypothetical protein
MSDINVENDNQSCRDFEFVKKSLATTSNELVTAVQSKDERGIFVEATQSITLQAGSQNIMTCQAAAFALDSAFRQTHCGFCAASTKYMHTCSSCQLVSACTSCLPLLTTTGHHTNNKECSVLKKFKATFGPTIDSTHLLTIRLLCCQEGDWWKLFHCLYANVAATSPMDQDIAVICSHLPAPANDTQLYTQTLARVLGCSHNITDVSRPLGNQSLGRAMFLEQSFYNHSCVPNAFLSCNFMLPTTDKHTGATTTRKNAFQLTANVHLLRPVQKGDQITISYIPMSGLSIQERRQRLQEGYGVDCNCIACTDSKPKISLSGDMDVESIREIQYSCNDQLLEQGGRQKDSNENEIEQTISLIQMTQRGIRNQSIPESHEVSIETERLFAMAHTLLENWNEAKEHHRLFFKKVETITDLFDPVALATQYLEYFMVLDRSNDSKAGCIRQEFLCLLKQALGKDHVWLVRIWNEPKSSWNKIDASNPDLPNNSPKRQKVSNR